MKRVNFFPAIILCLPILFGCAKSSPGTNRLIINDYEVAVEEALRIEPTFTGEEEPVTYLYSGDDIRIEDGYIRGLLAGTVTNVTASTPSGLTASFGVAVTADNYVATVANETAEGWFDPISVNPIAALKDNDEFPLGIDISMVKQIYDCGGQFYNDEGRAESVYRILADHGVNYVRIRLWNDPYNHVGNTLVPYGGGICDLATALYMAKGAKAAGLKIFLDFHLSDFWSDPANQVIPKEWANFSTAAEVANALQNYVTNTLDAFADAAALPDMVQLGNETTPGLFTSAPGPTNTHLTGGNPYYISQKGSISANISGASGTENFRTYMSAALAGVHAVSPDMLTMIHLAKGMTATSTIKNYFHQFDGLDYDVIGLSAYSYYHFTGGIPVLRSCLQSVSAEFPDKKITLAETAYGFTNAADANTSNIFSDMFSLSGYPVSVQGQASLLRDITNEIAAIPNGYGVFYWEGAWIPVKGAGWADSNSKCSWANQALFSYDGKALPSLATYRLAKA